MPEGDNAPPVAVTVETSPAEHVSTDSADAVIAEAAAQSAVLAAGTAIALAEGQAAVVAADAAATIAEVTEEQDEWHARVAALEAQILELNSRNNQLQMDMSTLIAALEEFSTQHQSPQMIQEQEAAALAAAQATDPALVTAEASLEGAGDQREAETRKRYRYL